MYDNCEETVVFNNDSTESHDDQLRIIYFQIQRFKKIKRTILEDKGKHCFIYSLVSNRMVF